MGFWLKREFMTRKQGVYRHESEFWLEEECLQLQHFTCLPTPTPTLPKAVKNYESSHKFLASFLHAWAQPFCDIFNAQLQLSTFHCSLNFLNFTGKTRKIAFQSNIK